MPTRAELASTSLPAIRSFGCGAFLQLRCVLPSGGVSYNSVALSRAQAAREAICKRGFSCQLSIHCGQTRFLLQIARALWADEVSPTNWTARVGRQGFSHPYKLHVHCGLARKQSSKGSLKRQATSGSDAESLAQVTSEAGRRIAISTDSRRKGYAALLASGARVPPILCALLVLPNHLALSR